MSKALACPSEHQEQKWLFQWAEFQSARYPALKLMYAVPNGGKRDIITASVLRDEGVKSGVPDVMLPAPIGRYHGLYIEMKRQQGGRLSDSQKEWLHNLREQGYATVVCKGTDEAQSAIMDYLNGKEGWRAYGNDKF